MATANRVHPFYVRSGDRIEHIRQEIDQAKGDKLYDSIVDELPKFEHTTWPNLARHCLVRHDEVFNVPESKRYDVNRVDDHAVCERALSNAAIVETFSTVIGNRLLEAAEAEPDSTRDWVYETSAVNFLPASLFTLEQSARLEKYTKGREADHTSYGTKAQAWGINRYSGQFRLDEQNMLDGEHVGATLLAVSQHGAAAARVRPDLIYALLLNNPTLDADNTALFHSNHSNKATGGGSAMQDTALDTAMSAIGRQHLTDLQEHGDPIHINLQGKFVIVPPELSGKTRRAVRNMVLGDGNDLAVRQESRLSALGVVDPKADTVVTGSATNWLLTAPAASVPSIVVGGLNGSLLPQIRRFDLDRGQWGIAWDIILDIGAAAVDYRGVYFSVGA